MNAVEQKQRRSLALDVQGRFEDVATVLEALDTRIAAVAQATLDTFGDERKDIARAFDAVDRSVVQLHVRTALLADSTVWSRLRWIATGR